MEWIMLVLPFIQAIIQNCDARGRRPTEEDRRELGVLAIRRAVKRAGVPRAKRKQARNEIKQKFRSMSEEEVDQFCRDCLTEDKDSLAAKYAA